MVERAVSSLLEVVGLVIETVRERSESDYKIEKAGGRDESQSSFGGMLRAPSDVRGVLPTSPSSRGLDMEAYPRALPRPTLPTPLLNAPLTPGPIGPRPSPPGPNLAPEADEWKPMPGI